MPSNIVYQTIEAQRTWLNAAYVTGVRLQEQSEQLLRGYMNSVPWMDENAKKTMDSWLNSYKEGQEAVKKAVDENLSNMEKMFSM